MDSDSLTYISIALLLIVSGIFSLVKVVFSNLYPHFEEQKHKGTHFEAIHHLFASQGFSDIIP